VIRNTQDKIVPKINNDDDDDNSDHDSGEKSGSDAEETEEEEETHRENEQEEQEGSEGARFDELIQQYKKENAFLKSLAVKSLLILYINFLIFY
jgi:hypothetical protein